MATKVRQQQPDTEHRSAQILLDGAPGFAELASGRGRQRSLFGPRDGSAVDVHVIELDAGSAPGRYHLHTASEAIYVILAGTVLARHPDGAIRLRAGDAARFPAGVPHSATAVGRRRARLLEIYAPGTADFVPLGEPDHARSPAMS